MPAVEELEVEQHRDEPEPVLARKVASRVHVGEDQRIEPREVPFGALHEASAPIAEDEEPHLTQVQAGQPREGLRETHPLLGTGESPAGLPRIAAKIPTVVEPRQVDANLH